MKTPPTNTPSRLRRWVRRLLWTALILATLISLYYAVENWRGAKVWQAAKSAYEAAGETLEWNELLVQDRIPDVENFFAVPLLNGISKPMDEGADALRARLQGPRSRRGRGRPLKLSGMRPEDRERLGGFKYGRPTNYEVWREIVEENGLVMPTEEPDAARAILVGLEEAIDWFAEMDEASNRPQSQILPLASDQFDSSQPWAFGQPHIGACRSALHWLSDRAKAASGCRETDMVRDSLTSMFRFIHGMKDEPTLISLLLTNVMTSTLIHSLWESLHVRLWDGAHLQTWDHELAQLQLVQAHRQCLQTEAAFTISFLDHIKRASMKESTMLMGLSGPIGTRLSGLKVILTPDGHIDRERASRLTEYMRLHKAFNSTNLVSAKQLLESYAAEAQADSSNPFRKFGDLSTFSDILASSVQIITQVEQARIAIALERHYLFHQRYPEVLGELVPTYIEALPKDPMGEAWQYQPTPEQDTYLLYSLGWNQVDDGGVRPEFGKRKTGDIVWIR